MPTPAFTRFWQVDLTREAFLNQVTKDDLVSLRQVSHDFADTIAPMLFRSVTVNFNVNTFGRRARMLGLESIGHHIKTFKFQMPHDEDTFLPPLIDPDTLEELSFHYQPQLPSSRPSSSSSASSTSKYGSWEINDLLVRQYPPLFHAATNITSFIRAFSSMPCIRHLRISCPSQPTGQEYRRNTVDYALTSLRIAIEHVNPPWLDTMSLDPIHPRATFYLRPQTGIGTSPASTRIWHRIRRMKIYMDSPTSLDFQTDHLKILHSYLTNFPKLENLCFTWLGAKGPCPLSFDSEPCVSRPSSLDCSTSCPISSAFPACRPLKLRHLRTLRLRNVLLDASQASSFISLHRKVLRDLEFDECRLRSGTWDDALAPLRKLDTNGSESKHSSTTSSPLSEVMDVPIFFTPQEERSDPLECVNGQLWPVMAEKELSQRVRVLDVLRAMGKQNIGIGVGGRLGRLRSLWRSVKPVWP